MILDPEKGLWLHLADGVSLDHEAGSYGDRHRDGIPTMATATLSDSTEVTITVNDVNEAPMAVRRWLTTVRGRSRRGDSMP